MIAIKSKYPSRKYCYGGSGILSDILKKIVSKTASSTVARKVINAATTDGLKAIAKSTVAHKFADAVVNGAASATQKAVEDVLIKKIQQKRKAPASTTTTTIGKKLKADDITNLINGSGIILD